MANIKAHVTRKDIYCLLILLPITIFVRLLLINQASVIYGQDAYRYLNEAMNFASSGVIQLKAGLPFVFFLGIFLKIFGSMLGTIVASRVFMLSLSALFASTMYLVGSKMAGRIFGIIVALLASLEPISLSYSIVPHNDVFAFTMGLLSLYCAYSLGRIRQYVLAPVFSYLAVSTRPEFYLALIVPILVFFVLKVNKSDLFTQQKQSMTLKAVSPILFMIVIYILPSVFMYQYVQPLGRLGIIERLALFLKPELIVNPIHSAIFMLGQQWQDRAIFVLVVVGIISALLTKIIYINLKRHKNSSLLIKLYYHRGKRVKEIFGSYNVKFAVCICLFFVLHVFALTIWGHGYEWAFYVDDSAITNIDILRQALIIIPQLHDRYLIPLRLLVFYPLAYPLSLAVRKAGAFFEHKG